MAALMHRHLPSHAAKRAAHAASTPLVPSVATWKYAGIIAGQPSSLVSPTALRTGIRALPEHELDTVSDLHVNETPEEAQNRRLRESAVVESRVTYVHDFEELQDRLAAAGNKLVALEVFSESECQSGIAEAELHWRGDQRDAQMRSIEACRRIKHTFMRTARECDNVVFLEIQIPEDEESGQALKDLLGVEMVPTLQFIRNGHVLWHEQGYAGMEKDIGEAVLYYSHQAADGLKATDYVKELETRGDLNSFVNGSDPNMLVVLDVSTTMCKPCIKIYPAVLALARNFVGQIQFGRLLADASDEAEDLLRQLNILEVPTFVFFRGGREVGRLVSSARGDLIGHILQLQADAGIAPPPPPPRAGGRAQKAPVRQRASSGNRWR